MTISSTIRRCLLAAIVLLCAIQGTASTDAQAQSTADYTGLYEQSWAVVIGINKFNVQFHDKHGRGYAHRDDSRLLPHGVSWDFLYGDVARCSGKAASVARDHVLLADVAAERDR